jgi:hypothetical protein
MIDAIKLTISIIGYGVWIGFTLKLGANFADAFYNKLIGK